MTRMLVLDEDVSRDLIKQRKKLGINDHDEVWDGVYVMPSVPNLKHQKTVHDFEVILDQVVVKERKGDVYPGVNVSDQPRSWKKNYRVPDVVVILDDGEAIKFDTYVFGGPDFLIEIRSPKEDPEEKIRFYEKIRVRELLIVHRDSRKLKLLRHNGQKLVEVAPTHAGGERWLHSEVLPLAFRRAGTKAKPRLEVKRTDGKPGNWTV